MSLRQNSFTDVQIQQVVLSAIGGLCETNDVSRVRARVRLIADEDWVWEQLALLDQIDFSVLNKAANARKRGAE